MAQQARTLVASSNPQHQWKRLDMTMHTCRPSTIVGEARDFWDLLAHVRETLSQGTKADSDRPGHQCAPLASAQTHAPHTCTLTQRRNAPKVWTVRARDKTPEETKQQYPTLDRGPRAPDKVTTSNPILLPPCLTSCV